MTCTLSLQARAARSADPANKKNKKNIISIIIIIIIIIIIVNNFFKKKIITIKTLARQVQYYY
jgi:t-SNARE complex subunit (syntaxin)